MLGNTSEWIMVKIFQIKLFIFECNISELAVIENLQISLWTLERNHQKKLFCDFYEKADCAKYYK